MYEPAIRRALRLARGGYAYGGIPMPDFSQQGPSTDIYSQVPGVGAFSFNPAMPSTVDNIPSGRQGPAALPSPYTPTPAGTPAAAPAEPASTAYMPEGGGGSGGEGIGTAGGQDAADMSGGEDGEGGANDGVSSADNGPGGGNGGDNGPGGGNGGEKRGGRIWPKNNTGDNAVRLARLIHEEMRSDPLFERKIQSILSRL